MDFMNRRYIWKELSSRKEYDDKYKREDRTVRAQKEEGDTYKELKFYNDLFGNKNVKKQNS